MGVGLGLAVRADIPMDIEVGDHALFDELGLGKLARQLDALFPGQLARNGEFDLAGKLRVLALLGASTAFQSFSRSANSSGAPSGSITSEWTTPSLLVKSWSRSSRSSCSRSARDRRLPPRRCARSTG
jgi:hypothetical protein